MSEDGMDNLAAVAIDLPDADALIDSRRGEVLAVRVPGDGIHPVGRFAERVEPLSRGRVPHLDGTVGPAGSEQLAVRTEADAIDRVTVVLQIAQQLAGGHVPQLDDAIITATGE